MSEEELGALSRRSYCFLETNVRSRRLLWFEVEDFGGQPRWVFLENCVAAAAAAAVDDVMCCLEWLHFRKMLMMFLMSWRDVAASSRFCFLHLARLFLNQTCNRLGKIRYQLTNHSRTSQLSYKFYPK